jgi:hypothetical protein
MGYELFSEVTAQQKQTSFLKGESSRGDFNDLFVDRQLEEPLLGLTRSKPARLITLNDICVERYTINTSYLEAV